MTTPFYCLLVIMVFPYLAKLPAMKAMAQEGRGYDNKNPRDQQTRLTGWGKRAVAAHLNSFEILPIFASAVFMNHLTNADLAPVSSGLAVFFVVSRFAYVGLYLAHLAALRSMVWFAGIGACFALATVSLWG